MMCLKEACYPSGGHGQAGSTVNKQSGVPAVVHQQVRAAAVRPAEHLLSAPPVLLQRLALPGKDGPRIAGHRSRSVVLPEQGTAVLWRGSFKRGST